MGDTLTMRFDVDVDTSIPVGTKADLDALFTASQEMGDDYSGAFTNARTLVITIDDAQFLPAPPQIDVLVLTINKLAGFTSAAPFSLPSTASTGTLGGTFVNKLGPEIVSLVARDPFGNDAVYGTGDTITVSFDVSTSGPELFGSPVTLSEANLDTLLTVSNSLGTGQTGRWFDSQTLIITIGTPPTPTPPDTLPEIGSFTISVNEDANLQNEAKTSLASGSASVLTGDFGTKPGPAIVSLLIDDPDSSDIKLSNLDELTVSFDGATNEPDVATTADLDALFNSLDAFGTVYTGEWFDPLTLVITIVDATGGDVTIDTTTISVKTSGNLLNSGETSLASESVSTALVGSLGDKAGPSILAVIAHDPKATPIPGYDEGDTITVIWSEKTDLVNLFDKEDIDSFFTFSETIGDDYSGELTLAGDLVIKIKDGDKLPQPPVVGKLKLMIKEDVRQAKGGSLFATGASPFMSGNFGSYKEEFEVCEGGSTLTTFPAGITTEVTIPGKTCVGFIFEEADEDTPDRIEIIGEAFSITASDDIDCTIDPFCAIVVIFSQEQIPLDDDGTPIEPITEIKIFNDGEDPDDDILLDLDGDGIVTQAELDASSAVFNKSPWIPTDQNGC